MCIYKQNTGCTESSPEGKSMVAMMAHVRAGAEMGLGREGVGEEEGLIPGELSFTITNTRKKST